MKIKLVFITIFFCSSAYAQTAEIDSLKKLLPVTAENLDHVNILEALSYAYLSSYPDTALKYAMDGLQLAKRIDSRIGEAICIDAIGNVYFHIGDNAKALSMYLDYLKIKEEIKDLSNLSIAYYNIGGVYVEMEDYPHALYYLFKAETADEKAKDSSAILYDAYSLATTYLRMQKQDSALYYIDQSYRFAQILNDENMTGAILNTYGEIYFSLNNIALASKYYNLSIPYAEAVQDNEVLTSNYYGLAKTFKQKSEFDSSILYARNALTIARKAPFFKQVLEISGFLTSIFSTKKQFDSAFYYQQLSIATKDSLFNVEELRKVQNLKFSEQQRQQSIETAKIKYNNRVNMFIVIFTSVIFLIIALLLWRNNKQKHKTNLLLTEQKEIVESTLSELRSAQALLIQKEKMASLGELTAGIAHEIQNPLNFVNNFSDINTELVDDLQKELQLKNIEEATVIANDIKSNEEKINHHGKRADAIVKGMLEHSRLSTGVKEPTDINVLCAEYLRLSYHGMRAKDKFFNPDFKTDFDEGIGKINIVPQDIGRVLLNLFNNAFYAVKPLNFLKDEQYKPLVSVTTKKLNSPSVDGGVEIIVKDNGNGIPQNIIDKIFQPFFTTKPTGEGTGLGLSLAYDIITKEHGGTLKVESKDGEGTKFIIQLPIA